MNLKLLKFAYVSIAGIAIGVFSPLLLTAQSNVGYYNSDDELKSEIVQIMQTQEEKHFQDPGTPRFIMNSKNNKFALGIGGYVRLVNGVEFKGIIDSETDEGFQTGLIPIPYGDNPRSQYRLSASTSKFFVKMVGRTEKIGDIETFISMDFEGKNYSPRLHQAYVKMGGFLFGQAWSTITDLNSIPPTVDFEGPCGMAIVRNPQIRYARNMAHNWMRFGIATEFPQVNATYSKYTDPIYQSVPDVIGYLQLNWGKTKSSHMRASGILRNMSYRDLEYNRSSMEQGWGVQASGVWNMGRKVSLFYQGIYGKGIASYMNDISLFNVDLVPDFHNSGSMNPLEMWGMYAGMQYNFSKSVYASATYSQSRMYSRCGYDPSSDQYQYGQYIVGNIFWNITNDCSLALEYLHGEKKVFGGEKQPANRVNFMVQYSF